MGSKNSTMLEKPSEIQENRFMNSSNMFLTLPDVVLKEIMRKLSAREMLRPLFVDTVIFKVAVQSDIFQVLRFLDAEKLKTIRIFNKIKNFENFEISDVSQLD
ncbi:hypothetical protein B9Z55_026834 [Caenorhabditis nigoni]|uniref:F-box domain-containing protein n=1 Tax=Caenorhabditis nigoni TaxID=1611254 RepID=A0A2G5SHL9_9PELO|nr:hypothetical protein B9Z55_026834 [Caenorhabditis nigoni]